MAKLKKVKEEWYPSENKNLLVGETVEITDYLRLVKTGMAVLVDEAGNELPPPGEVFTCPICYRKTETLAQFTAHVGAAHSPVRPTVTIAEEEKPASALKEATQTREEQIKAQRVAALEKAREVKKMNMASK